MPRILVVDDEPLISMLIQDWLTELGCETVGPANSVPSALELVENAPLDAAILDLSLDGGDAYAVADALRAKGIPFTFATGRAEADVAVRFKDTPVLSKPFDFAKMKGTVTQLFNPHSSLIGRAD